MGRWVVRLISGKEILVSAYRANGEKFSYSPCGNNAWKTIRSKRVEYIDVAKPFSGSEERGKPLKLKLPRTK